MNKMFILLTAILICAINPAFSIQVPYDELVETTLMDKQIEKPYEHLGYNYRNNIKIPVKISITEKIKSEADIYEGQSVCFAVQEKVSYKGKTKFKKGDIINARVGTIITSGMNGIPASIIFENFEKAGIEPGQISNNVEVFGQDRTYFVFPLKWALTFLPPTGSLTNFIKGGHAKISPNKVLTIYYYPEWL